MAKRKSAPAPADLAAPAAMVVPSDEPSVDVASADDASAGQDDRLSPAEEALVEQAVEFLNGAARETGLRLAQTVSDYVVATFCDGDAAVLSSHVAFRRNTIAALSRHPRLQMGANTLRRLVRIGLQVRALPPEVALQLGPPQHRALLGVKDPERKVELARAAVAGGWSPQQIVAEIAKGKAEGGPKLGRPPKSGLVKRVAGVVRAVEGLEAEGTAAAFSALGEQERAEVVAGLRAVLSLVEAVLGGVGE